jgi:hypothetical protein
MIGSNKLYGQCDWCKLAAVNRGGSLNLGCLHSVACVRSGDGDFYIRLRNVTIVR